MRGTGPVAMGKAVVYSFFTVSGNQARVRMSADEVDRLDLFPGKQVQIGFSGGEVGPAPVADVSPAPPFVWVEVELAGEVPVGRAG